MKLISPEDTRVVIQFEKIDLEEQNDCLYDYISIEDDEGYESALETGLSLSSATIDEALAEENRFADYAADDLQRPQRQARRARRDAKNTKNFAAEPSFLPYVRWCGVHESNMTRFDFISSSNMVLINFHSDYSVSGSGFSLSWRAVSVNGCPTKTYTSIEDANTITSPNHPNVLLNNLDCTYVIYAPSGKKIWLEFRSYDFARDSFLEIDLGEGFFMPFKRQRQLNDGVFVSYQNRITIRLKTGAKPKGNGFHLTYKTCKCSSLLHFALGIVLFHFASFYFAHTIRPTLSAPRQSFRIDARNLNFSVLMNDNLFSPPAVPFVRVDGYMERRSITLTNKTSGALNHLNYPQRLPPNIDFTQQVVVPLGEVISLEIYDVGISDSGCHSANKIEVNASDAICI